MFWSMPTPEDFIAHVRHVSGDTQSLEQHLKGVSALAQGFASKKGLGLAGELVGLLHDLGKYSQEFQNYLKSATGLLNPDEDDAFVDAKGLKGKVDHSSAGAQLVWTELSKQGQLGQVVGQILALCIASHHSGLIDCLTSSSSEPVTNSFLRRMRKPGEKTHLEEVQTNADAKVMERFRSILVDKLLIQSLKKSINDINQCAPDRHENPNPRKSIVAQFQTGLLVRFIFSCLIDADRVDTADFEKPNEAAFRLQGRYATWEKLIRRLESHLSKFTPRHPIDKLRNEISNHCLEAASLKKGVYTLTVPTGGGKTLASLRFAVHHARNHGMDRVVYVIPFTSIIDQNADVTRKILEPSSSPDDLGRIVLEHHSNLEPAMMGWKQKILADNWDAPIIYTTSVQFLETLFGAGTRGARRMHQLANAVIIFDEIQTLPIKCVHLFNNAVNFLVEQCGSTVVLCTATQPLLSQVDPKKGAIPNHGKCEIMPDVKGLFENLKRVKVEYTRKPEGWQEKDIAELALNEAHRAGSCLVVVNTKKAAKGLFRCLDGNVGVPTYHLSTSMCPIHRREVLSDIRIRLDAGQPTLCISTQLIEAGVDIDFGAVIRFAAGLDSIAQAAGRCNRNGTREMGVVHVVNPAGEDLEYLEDIRIGREKTDRVFDDFRDNPDAYDNNLIGPKAIEWYYKNYFFDRQDEMGYRISSDLIGRDDTLLNLLSINSLAHDNSSDNYLRQSFMAAAKAFRALDAPTRGVIVQYGKVGRDLVAEICSAFEVEKQFKLLRRAQQFTVNLFPHEFRKLEEQDALTEVQQGTEIYYLNERYYSKDFGLATEPVTDEEFLHV
jgi:CRISPR-associated endonuclease/helicase Cas3